MYEEKISNIPNVETVLLRFKKNIVTSFDIFIN